MLCQQRRIEARDVAPAAANGDPLTVDLLTRSGRLVGEMLAHVVNFFNPSPIVIGGGVAAAGDLLLASIRQTVYGRSLPLATRELPSRTARRRRRTGFSHAGGDASRPDTNRSHTPTPA